MARATRGLLALIALAGCASQPEGTAVLVDPTAAQTDMGTLVDVSDVKDISQKLVDSLRQSPSIADLLRERRPVQIAIETREIKNLTSMTNFSKKLFINQMLSSLNKSAGDDFRFLDREAVAAERARQASGEAVDRGGTETLAGAELVLAGRILEKLDQRPAAGGSVEETRSVQFTFNLVRVKDAVTLWTDSFFRVKQQVIGTVYG
jgi:hypothetical protein